MSTQQNELSLMPLKIERSKAAHKLNATEARVLQALDVTFQPGILRRGPGYAKTRLQKVNFTIMNGGIATRRDGRRMIWTYAADGTIRVTVMSGAQGCPASPVEWEDREDFTTTTFPENFDDDGGGSNPNY